METLEAEFDIVTPMFLGDADQKATRIRESSIKGALAFWWRAKKFASLFTTDNPSEIEITGALAELQEREKRIFGSVKGRGIFDLRVTHGPTVDDILRSGRGQVLTKRCDVRRSPDIRCRPHEYGGSVGHGARYLGYGLITAFATKHEQTVWAPAKSYGGQLDRDCFRLGRSFSLQIRFRPLCSEIDRTDALDVKAAVKLFGLLGGLGSRARRGWGSVALSQLSGGDEWMAPTSLSEYRKNIKDLIGEKVPHCSGTKFPLTAFAREMRIRTWLNGRSRDECRDFYNGLDALNDVGEGLLCYRARGKLDGGVQKVGQIKVDASFVDDHDWYRKENKFADERGSYVPLRTAFGLPHSYHRVFGVGAPAPNDRRASPILFHIHKIGATYIPVALLLPTKFLPDNIVGRAEAECVFIGNPSAVHHPATNQYAFDKAVITDYLDGKKHVDRGTWTGANQRYFPGEDIWP